MAPMGSRKGGSARAKGSSNQEDHDRRKRLSRTASSTSLTTSTVSSCNEDLVSVAAKAKLSTQWESILLSARAGPGRWKTEHKIGDFDVYHRQESHRYGVLAIGLVLGCPAEILNVLQCTSSAQYAPQMEAIFGDQFKHGECLGRMGFSTRNTDRDGSRLVELMPKMVTFNRASWFAHPEQWCYLDAVYRNATNGAAEKLMTPIDPHDVGLERDRETRLLRDVSCAYLLLPELREPQEKSNQDNQESETSQKPLTSTRIYFYGEYRIPKQLIASMQALGSEKTSRQRLLKLADSNARLTELIKRQRLGLQTLVDANRFLPPTNTPCRLCTKMLLVAKVCRLCGHSVCSDCSKKHERASQQHGSETIQVTKIRVCTCCMERVVRGIYENVTPTSLFGPRIVPDPVDCPLPDSVLHQLLHDELSAASTPSRKASVMTVIQCLQDQDMDTKSFRSNDSRRSSVASTTKSSRSSSSRRGSGASTASTAKDEDDFEAIQHVRVELIPHDHAVYRTGEDRGYQLDTQDPDSVLNAPLAEQEDERLRAVAMVNMDELCESMELQMLCNLAAAEMNCLYSTISIFDLEYLNCVATNAPAFERAKLPRSNTGCAHTILDPKPHLVPHIEADIRFTDALIVTKLGVRFYLGFPVYGDGDQIIGSFCVMNDKTVDVTESKFSIFTKLADTASKILRLHVNERRRKSQCA